MRRAGFRHLKVVAIMGGCHLDLRQAEITGPELSITAVAIMGGIRIDVPEGIEVELTGLPIMGGKDLKQIKTGFCWVVAGQGAPVTFYLDDIQYE